MWDPTHPKSGFWDATGNLSIHDELYMLMIILFMSKFERINPNDFNVNQGIFW